MLGDGGSSCWLIILLHGLKLNKSFPYKIDGNVAVSNTEKHYFVGYDGDICGAGAKALGVNQVTVEAGEDMPVTYLGIMLVVAGGAVASGAEVESDASGKAVTLAAGESNGRALDAATADGDVIRVVLKV